MLTRSRGRSNYIVTLNSRVKKNIFQPLTILEFQAISTKTELGKINQAEISLPLHNISMDIAKSTVAIFIAELLYRIVKEPLDDQNLYLFAQNSIEQLNEMEGGVANFHIWFLVHFAFYMGYELPREHNSGEWLDIKTGSCTPYQPAHMLKIQPVYAELLHRFSVTPLKDIPSIELSRVARRDLLHAMVDYFSYHCDTFNCVRSIEILSEVF